MPGRPATVCTAGRPGHRGSAVRRDEVVEDLGGVLGVGPCRADEHRVRHEQRHLDDDQACLDKEGHAVLSVGTTRLWCRGTGWCWPGCVQGSAGACGSALRTC